MLSLCNNTLAGFLTLLIVGSAALFGLSPTASADSHATEIGCTTIEEPGVYHLADDLSGGNGDCLVIQAWDVTIDGQGHTIANTGGHAIAAERETVENVTIRNLEIVDAGDRGIQFFQTGGDVTIHDVTVENATGIAIAFGPEMREEGVHIEDVTATDSRVGIFVGDVADVTVQDVTLRDNEQAGLWSYDYAHPRVEDATITGNGYGVQVELGGSVTGTGLDIRNNDVGVLSGQDTPGEVEIHESVIAGNDIGADANFQRRDINLTHNYWGAADGPSSVGDEPVADPMTGTLANGSGDAIAGDGDGTALARFDPWLAVPALGDELAGPPQDLDGDGLYEDVNGNGESNLVDVQALFANRESSAVTDNAAQFDFSGNGAFDLVDIQALFARVTT